MMRENAAQCGAVKVRTGGDGSSQLLTCPEIKLNHQIRLGDVHTYRFHFWNFLWFSVHTLLYLKCQRVIQPSLRHCISIHLLSSWTDVTTSTRQIHFWHLRASISVTLHWYSFSLLICKTCFWFEKSLFWLFTCMGWNLLPVRGSLKQSSSHE